MRKPPAPVAADGVMTYPLPADVVDDKPAASGVSVTLVTTSLPTPVAPAVKLIVLVPADNDVPYVLPGPVAVTVNAFAVIAPFAEPFARL